MAAVAEPLNTPTWCDTASIATRADLTPYEGVGRYINEVPGSHNGLTDKEINDLFAAGKKIFIIWQDGKGESLGGYNNGVDRAKKANAACDARGVPSGMPIIYVFNDNNLKTEQIKDYARGLMSVQGRPVGGYGSFNDIEYLATLPNISTLMQTTAWSGGKVSSHAHLFQKPPIDSGSTKVDPVVFLASFPAWSSKGVAMTYPDLTANAPFTQASKTSGGSNSPVNRLVVHHTVSKTQRGGAQATANGFASPNAGGSAHYTVDPGAVVQSVKESVIAWHAPPNGNSIGVEMTDLCIWQAYPSSNAGQLDSRFANNEGAFHARWSLPDWQQMLARTAIVFRNLADKHGVPLVRLSVADLAAGKRGICGHREVSFWKKQSSHIDPYACDSCSGDFPWGQFMDMVVNPEKAVAILGGTTPPPPPAKDWFDMATQEDLNRAVRENTPASALFLVTKRDDPTGAVWLSNLVTRRWVTSYDDLLSVYHWFDNWHITDKTVYQVDDLDFYGAPIGDNPPAATSLRESAPALGEEEIARAQAGVPNEESSPGVHAAGDSESLEGVKA
jgi:hypothetical protein